MGIGVLELVAVASIAALTGLVHLLTILVRHARRESPSRRVLLVYGLPACFALGALNTPPDFLSQLVLTAWCLVPYAGVVVLCLAASAGRPETTRERGTERDAEDGTP